MVAPMPMSALDDVGRTAMAGEAVVHALPPAMATEPRSTVHGTPRLLVPSFPSGRSNESAGGSAGTVAGVLPPGVVDPAPPPDTVVAVAAGWVVAVEGAPVAPVDCRSGPRIGPVTAMT